MTSETRDPGHGWIYERRDGRKARCGGPALCSQCAGDYFQKYGVAWTQRDRVEAGDMPLKAQIARLQSLNAEMVKTLDDVIEEMRAEGAVSVSQWLDRRTANIRAKAKDQS